MHNPFRHLKYLTLLAFFLTQTACATLSGPLSGTVIDKNTGKPIEGAIVVAHWKGDGFHPVDSRTVCFHVESATTDQQGKFRITAFPAAPVGVMNAYSDVAGVYKEGYREVTYKDTQEPGFQKAPRGFVYLIPFTGTIKERIDYLARLKSKASCSEAGASEKNLFLMAKAVFEETKQIAITEEDKKWVARFRRSAASVAVARDSGNHMTGREMDILIDEFLRDNLK